MPRGWGNANSAHSSYASSPSMVPCRVPGFPAITTLSPKVSFAVPLWFPAPSTHSNEGLAMRNHYHSSESSDYPRRTDRSQPMALSGSGRESARNCPIGHGQRSIQTNNPPESEPDRGGGQNRRRIAVAVR